MWQVVVVILLACVQTKMLHDSLLYDVGH